jgi:glycosyltransferase involved in cell wall biosynthesis
MVDVNRAHIRGPVLKVPAGVDLDGMPAEHPSRPRQPLRFGFMGGFQPNKGIWDILDAAATLQRQGLDFELHVWGPENGAARTEIEGRGLKDRVALHGMYDGAGVWGAYDEIDVAIIATTVPEPFGRIPIEAAAAGAPTIGARVGGITESIRHGENGLLYDFRDSADLTKQMKRILDEPGLFERLLSGLAMPTGTRDTGAAIEAAYRSVLADAGIGSN